MARRIWNLTVVPDRGLVRSFKVSFSFVLGLVMLLTTNVALVAGSGFYYFKNLKLKQDTRRVRSENSLLRNHLDGTEVLIQQLETVMAENERLEARARAMAGIESLSADSLRAGVGGPFLAASEISRYSEGQLAASVNGQTRRLDALIRRVGLQRETYQATLDSLAVKNALLARTPSASPLKSGYTISSGFGVRSDPFTGERGEHNGLDLRAPNGTPVFATADGRVVHAGYDGDFGKCVRIDHGHGVETVYCHMSTVEVEVDQEITRGTEIGAVGSTGRSTGSHLHYEIHVDGVPRDPSSYMLSPASKLD